MAHGHDATPPPVVAPAKAAKSKRKLEDIQEREQPVSTSQNKRLRHDPTQGIADTPGKRTADLLSKLDLEKRSAPIPFALGSKKSAYTTPPDTPEASSDPLPSEINQLILLHSAFMSALSFWYAHNGAASSVQVKELLPMIAKTWKKRAVSTDDLQMLLGINDEHESEFRLTDFGRAGVQLIRQQPQERGIHRVASFVNEAKSNRQFEDMLRKRWTDWKPATTEENVHVSAFIEQLPRVTIIEDASVAKAAPLFARGQQRLADIKASQAAAQENISKSAPHQDMPQQSTQTVQNRGTSLLDRVLAKQAHIATLPTGPTKEQLERKAALHRIEDIVRVLDLLAAGRPRCSFSMQAVTQQLQQSMRTPISKAEVEKCLGLMATEITPGWVAVVQSAMMTGIVVTKSGRVDSGELRRRVRAAN